MAETIATLNLIHSLGLPISLVHRKITQMTRVGHGIVLGYRGSLQNLAFPSNIFAMVKFAMAVPYKRYYRKTANISVKQSLYTSVIDSHIENSKN